MPLPEAAGPSMAIITRRSRAIWRAPSPFISATKPGKLVAMVRRRRSRPAPGPPGRAPGRPWRCGGRAWSRCVPPPRGGAARALRRSGCRSSTSSATPQAARPCAMAAEAVAFLDPELREAAHHRAPAAKAAATARIGYSSIMRGARSAGTVDALSAAGAHGEVGHRLAARLRRFGEARCRRPSRAACR